MTSIVEVSEEIRIFGPPGGVEVAERFIVQNFDGSQGDTSVGYEWGAAPPPPATIDADCLLSFSQLFTSCSRGSDNGVNNSENTVKWGGKMGNRLQCPIY